MNSRLKVTDLDRKKKVSVKKETYHHIYPDQSCSASDFKTAVGLVLQSLYRETEPKGSCRLFAGMWNSLNIGMEAKGRDMSSWCQHEDINTGSCSDPVVAPCA
jgi:hypothetical protein